MDNPIRILHVFARLDRGGAETMIMNIYRNIDRSKIQFDFLVHTDDTCAYDNEIQNLGGTIYRFPKYTGINHASYKRRWNSFLRENIQHKIIHGHVRSLASIYLRVAKKYGRITIAHSHNTSSGQGLKAFIKDLYQMPIRYISDYLFACSIEAGIWLFGKSAVKKNNFFIIKNAIKTDLFIFNQDIREKIRRDLGLEERFVVGHIGRFHPQKNHSFIIDVFYAIIKQHPNSVLLLVGDGELRNSIEEKVNSYSLSDKVIFTGVKENANELLQAMDVFIFPSLYEGLGIVAIEAQAAGLPCIVSDTVPSEAIITEDVRQLSLKKSINEWKESVLKYLSFKRKNNKEEIIRSGYDIQSTVKLLESFYLDVWKD